MTTTEKLMPTQTDSIVLAVASTLQGAIWTAVQIIRTPTAPPSTILLTVGAVITVTIAAYVIPRLYYHGQTAALTTNSVYGLSILTGTILVSTLR